ncbi:MAG: DUF4810 domain-containing protein [Bacteroidales bacterium]|jgi:hypothetical protein|nr:DUF4810 domain-containing protein [Bacteroidales bacterium]MCI1733968.1 DUF4810 domain-containing protein [Bacteroidales bacterium]
MKKIIIVAICSIALFSCGTSAKSLYTWSGYNDAVYAYSKKHDDASLKELMSVCENLINNPLGARGVPAPGLCSDYGYLLIQSGQVDKGKYYLKKEMELYPESKPFIDGFLKRFE